VRLRLYGRRDCHLCDEMIAGLRALQPQLAFQLDVLDVDLDPTLEARHGALVPVLVDASEEEICHYWLDEDALRRRLALK
jgi:Glutaredoxin-like domain (DUF836)